jgi:reactive intermediate/imine deaminase
MRVVFLLALSAMAASGVMAQQKEVLKVPGAVEGLPFSPAIRVGNIIYLSGQLGSKIGTRELIAGGITAETRQTLENIKTVLQAAGSSLDKVFKCTVFLADIADYGKMNEVYATFFPMDPPARSTIAGSGLALGAKVEIECMAVST